MSPPEKRREGPQALSTENLAATMPPDKHSLPNPGLDQATANSASDWWHSGAMLAIRQLALSGRDMAGEPEEIDAINDALQLDVRGFNLPAIEIPEAGLVAVQPMPLLDSWWSFTAQCKALIDSKAYRLGGAS